MNKLDEFFKEKLTNHSIAPSAGAWQKVESGLSKKNNGVIWLRWAAVVLLGALLLGTLWMQREDLPAPMAKDKLPPAEVEKENQQPLQPAIAEKLPETKNVVREKKAKSTRTSQPIVQEEIQQADLKKEEAQVKEKLSVQLPETDLAAKQTSQGIVLTYTLDAITPSGEKSETEPAIVAATEKKGKSLKRMMDFAKNIKHSESPLGELRIKKGELFALDLKKKPTSKKQ